MPNPLQNLGTILAGITGPRLSRPGTPPLIAFNHAKPQVTPTTKRIVPVFSQVRRSK